MGNLTWSNQEQITWSGNLTSTSSTDNYDVAVGEGDTIEQPKPYSPEWPVTIKVDYADGMAGPNTSLYVFNQSGDLILVGQNSGVTDSQAVPALGSDLTDLNRGSEGNGDPYIGPVYLPSGADGVAGPNTQSYDVVVTNQDNVPSALSQPTARLEPIDSLQRVAEDHIGSLDGSAIAEFSQDQQGLITDNGNTVSQAVAASAATLNLHADPFSLSDCTTYVSTNSQLYTVDPFTGQEETLVTPETPPTSSGGSSGGLPSYTTYSYGTLAMSNDAGLYTIGNGFTNTQNVFGQLDTGNANNWATGLANGNGTPILSANGGLADTTSTTGMVQFQQFTFDNNGNPSGIGLNNSQSSLSFNAMALDPYSTNADIDRMVWAVGNIPSPDDGWGTAAQGFNTGVLDNGTNMVYILKPNGTAINYPPPYSTNVPSGPYYLSNVVPIGQFSTANGLQSSSEVIVGMVFEGGNTYAISDHGWLYQVTLNGKSLDNCGDPVTDAGLWGFQPTLSSVVGPTATNKLATFTTASAGLQLTPIGQVPGTNFTGLTAGPQDVENGAYKDMLFATDVNGEIWALTAATGRLTPITKTTGAALAPISSTVTPACPSTSSVSRGSPSPPSTSISGTSPTSSTTPPATVSTPRMTTVAPPAGRRT